MIVILNEILELLEIAHPTHFDPPIIPLQKEEAGGCFP
jgi:hypothetical protein